MHPTTRRSLALLAAGAAALAGIAGGVNATAAPGTSSTDPNSDAKVSTGLDSTSAIVGLSEAPLATDPKLAPAKGKKVDFNSSAAKSERAKLVAQRNTFKQWMKTNYPKATVTGEYSNAVNAVAVRLNGTDIAALRNGPGVVSVGYQGTYRPTADPVPNPRDPRSNGGQDPDLSLINATSPTDPTAGKGVKVGVIDTGIDVTHPCFSDGTKTGYTNSKVIIAKVFANKAAKMGYDAKAVQDHGTHVAGTIACKARTAASIDGAAIPYGVSGVAPGALLGSYNVFPGDIEDARSEDILNALDAAAADGMDVINMSLGGDAHGVADLLTNAVDNLDRSGIVVAVSAGNDGPGHFTVGSPGSAERALTAGASSVGHYMSTPVTIGGKPYASNGDGDFPVESDVSGNLVKSVLASGEATPNPGLGIGCTPASIPAAAKDNIVLVSRGTCDFAVKVDNAAAKGAKAVIVVNKEAGDPIAMAGNPALQAKPAVMISQDEYKASPPAEGAATTITAKKAYEFSGNDNIMGDFSSQGPTDVDLRVKPDLVAPGVNVLSSIPNNATYCKTTEDTNGCWAFFNGTSMASPHLAGTAAVVIAEKGWRGEKVRSAITNTAQQHKLTKFDAIKTEQTDPLVTGAGLADVKGALAAKIALSKVSTSFGAVPSGSGKSLSSTIDVSSLTGAAQTVTWSIAGDSAFGPASGTIVVPASGSVPLTVTYNPAKAIAKGDHSAILSFGPKGDIAHSVLYAYAK